MKRNPRKPKCDVRTHLACNGQAVRKVTGTKKTDPIFNICIGCRAYLNRQGVKLRDVKS